MNHPDGLAAARATAAPGCCIFCEEPLPPHRTGRKRVICGDTGCKTAYVSAFQRDKRLREGRTGETTWHCGCGMVARRSGWGSHRKVCLYAAIAYPVVVVPAMRSAA